MAQSNVARRPYIVIRGDIQGHIDFFRIVGNAHAMDLQNMVSASGCRFVVLCGRIFPLLSMLVPRRSATVMFNR